MALRSRSAARCPTSVRSTSRSVVILPVPVDRTTSYIPAPATVRARFSQASSHMELWDEEVGADVHGVGIFTLPEMELPFGELAPLMDEIERVAARSSHATSFWSRSAASTRSPRRSLRPPRRRYPGLSVLQIDAHADLRDCYMGTPHNHACAMRRTLEYAPVTQVGIRSMSTEEAAVAPSLETTIFYDVNMRQDPDWIDRVVSSLHDPVYITIDVDGMDPAIMPATGTPEPGGLSWYEMLALLRATIGGERVVACDVVELSPIPGIMAPELPLREAGLQDPDVSVRRIDAR